MGLCFRPVKTMSVDTDDYKDLAFVWKQAEYFGLEATSNTLTGIHQKLYCFSFSLLFWKVFNTEYCHFIP